MTILKILFSKTAKPLKTKDFFANASFVWEGRVLPMNYTRMILFHYTIESGKIQPNFGSHLEHVEFNEFFEDELYKVQKSLGTVAKIRSQLHGKVQQIGHWAAWVKASFLLEKTNK